MANIATKYGKVGKHFADGDIDYLNNTIKIIFLKSSYTPNFDTDETVTNLVLASNEVTGVVYTAGGETLGTKTAVYDSANDYTLFGAGDITLDNETIASIKYMVIADTTSTYLITCITLDPAISVTSQQLKVSFTDGVFSM
jgi:hypothetical protein